MSSGYKIYSDKTKSIAERVNDLISRMTLKEKISQMVHDATEISRLDLPAYNWWNECLHGVARSGRATVFPQAIGLAATFDEDLIFRIASSISDEARAMYHAAIKRGNHSRYGGLTFWSPNVNIFRDPRWGRGQETYGEDPILTSRLGIQFVKGLQGDHPKYMKAAACAKHYAVHSGPEGDRHHFNAKASKKDMFETYLPAFKALVDAGVEAVMCAYNRTNNEVCCASKVLLQEILREKWGFKGHVVSDCWAIKDFHENHKVTKDPAESAALALIRGINLNCGNTYRYLEESVNRGLISEEVIDSSLAILLPTRFKLGLFDSDEDNPYSKISADVISCKKHRDLAREAAQKSIVLLKNKNNILPLNKDINFLFAVGPMAASVNVLLGNYYGINDHLVTMIEGIVGKLNPGGIFQYEKGCLLDRDNINSADWTSEVTAQADATIAFMGISRELEGEEGESICSPTKGDRINMDLPQNQINFLKNIRAKNEKPIIVVLTAGSPMDLREVEEIADAILYVWYPGEEGGNGVADIMFGDVIPSGRLPITFPMSLNKLPPFEDYGMLNRTYRYLKDKPMYPFGFGLSYTSFAYSKLQLSKSEISEADEITATIKVKNSGDLDGDEVVQLYISDLETSVQTPITALKDFKRIQLKAGESKKVTFQITPNMLILIDNDGEEILEPGDFKVQIGPASPGKRAVELGLSPMQEAVFQLVK